MLAVVFLAVLALGAVGAALQVRHKVVASRLGRRLAAHRSVPGPRVARWWDRATERLAPIAATLEGALAHLLRRTPRLAAMSATIDEARVRVASSEVLATGVVVSVASATGLLALGAPAVAAVGVAAIVGVIPPGVAVGIAARRRSAFATALPDVLLLLAGTLRAGVPLVAALDAVAVEAGGPVAPEMRRVAGETALGRPLPEALVAVGRRMRSDEVAWVGMAVEIHQEAGGNLAEVLDTVARTIVERQRLRREVAALTAEGRISAVVLGVLPVGLAGVIAVVNPGYLSSLLRTPTGTVLVVGAAIGMAVGFVWMRRIVDVVV